MAGHSKWNNIKRTKGVADAKKGVVLGKISKELSIAVKIGGGADIKTNNLLRVAVQKAKDSNMTQERIQNAIFKGLGKNLDNNILTYEKSYEVFIKDKIYLVIDCETDNPNRTFTEIKTLTNKFSFKLLPEGSLSWLFKDVGVIKISNIDENLLLNIIAIEGVEDVNIDSNTNIITNKESFSFVLTKLREILNDNNIFEFGLEKHAKEVEKIEDSYISLNAQKYMEEVKKIPEVTFLWQNFTL